MDEYGTFFYCLRRFDTYIRITPVNNVYFTLDNFSSHVTTVNLEDLSLGNVEFLHPNTTSKSQPVNAGIIACLNHIYITAQYNRVLDVLDGINKYIYNIDQLTTIKYLDFIFISILNDIIFNFWRSTRLVGSLP